MLSMWRKLFRTTLLTKTAATNVKMLEPKTRYLRNELPDHQPGETVVIPYDRISNQILKYIAEIKAHVEPTTKNGKDGVYLGTAGIAYMFYHLSRITALADHRRSFLRDAVDYLQPALRVCAAEVNVTDVPAFMLGNCGVYAVAAVVYHALGDDREHQKYRQLYAEAAAICKDMFFQEAGSDEMFVGRAGYLCGAIWMANQTGKPYQADAIHEICRVMLASGRYYTKTLKSPMPLMYAYYDVEYIGAGHGVCSILQMLMSVSGYLLANPDDARDVQLTTDYVMSLQDKEGNFPAATDDIRPVAASNELVHWCHGAGGVVYMLAKAYLMYMDNKYLEACRKVADLIWEKGLLKKGPGLCHGVAGNGYVFLLLYRLTEEEMYLHRALQFSSFLEHPTFKHSARTPDNPYSLFEGIAGTVCFLGDLLEPRNAAFPFCDVF